MIGSLFNDTKNSIVVKSNVQGIMQHDGASWGIEKDHFIYANNLSLKAVVINDCLNNWVENVTNQERTIFVEELFGTLYASGATNITEVANQGVDGFESILFSITHTQRESRIVVSKLVKSIFFKTFSEKQNFIFKNKWFISNAIILAIGILFISLPESSLLFISSAILFFLTAFASYRIITYQKKIKKQEKLAKYSVWIYSIIIALMVILGLQKTLFLSSIYNVLGIIFFIYGIYNLRKCIQYSENNKVGFVILICRTVISPLLGCVILITSSMSPSYIFVIGSFLILNFMAELIFRYFEILKQRN